jgi:hypothetical protein
MRLLILVLALFLVQSPSHEPQIIRSLPEAAATVEPGIQPLTAQTLTEAIALGQGPEVPAEIMLPAAAFVKVHTMGQIVRNADLEQQLGVATEGPFRFSLRTPYVSAALQSADAKRKFEPVPTASASLLLALNAQKVVVQVTPGSKITNVDAIENVVIRRAGQIVRPLKASVTPEEVHNAMGMSKPSASGDFTFDFDTFAPTTAITLVLIGHTGNVEWPMSPAELALLR